MVGVLCVAVSSLICTVVPLPEIVRSLLALPAVLILPYQLGRLALRLGKRWIKDLPVALDALTRAVLRWWAGVVILAATGNLLQHLGLFAVNRALPWLVLGVLIVDTAKGCIKGGNAPRPDLHTTWNSVRLEWPLLVGLLLGLTPLLIHKISFPFPYFMRNSFTLANMVHQPVVRLLEDGYLTFEPSHRAGSYMLVFLPSALHRVSPLSMAWSLPLLQASAFALGLYLWAYELSHSRFVAALTPLFGGFVLSSGLLFETTPVIFRSNSVQLALLPLTLLVLHRYVDRHPTAKGLYWPAVLSAAGILLCFAAVHSDKLIWVGRLRALYPGQDSARLLHLYGVEWSARTATVVGWLALPVVLGIWSILGRDSPHRDLLLLFFLLLAFQFQLHAWEAAIFVAVAWAYLVVRYLLKRRSLYPILYALVAGLWLYWLLQGMGLITPSGTNPIHSLLFYWVSAPPDTPRVIDLLEVLRNAHAPLILALWALGTATMVALGGKVGLLVTLMSTLGLSICFMPEPNGVRAYKALLPFAAYTLAWIVVQTYGYIDRWPHRTVRAVALLAFTVALGWTAWELVQPYQRYYTRSQPGQRFAQYMADYEELTLAWLSGHLPDSARLVSDPHSMHLFSELTNSIDLLEHAMTTTEMSSVGQQQVRHIKESVFGAANGRQAHRALHSLTDHRLSFRNRDYAQKVLGDDSAPTMIVVLSAKTSKWIEEDGIDALFDPVTGVVEPVHLQPFYDLRFFRLLFQVDRGMFVFAARSLEDPVPGTASEKVAQGHDRWFGGLEDEAIALYEEASRLNPADPNAYIALGEAYRRRGDWDAAIEMLEQAAKYAEHAADLHGVIGDIHLVRGEPIQAVASFERALQLAENPSIYSSLGDALLTQGDVVAAGEAYAQSVASPYGRAETLAVLGDLYTVKGLPEQAEEAYLASLALSPRLTLARYGLARLYQAQGRTESAEAEYRRLIELDPAQAQWYAELEGIYLEQGRLDAAIGLYESAVARHPRSTRFNLALGRLFQSLANSSGGIGS
jgi:tetratricopeptide (TPR) repeat protein